MNKRIAQLRKAANLTQQEFADKIGLTKNFVSLLETGNRVPSDRTISDICREFNINESWLRSGDGDMMKPISRDLELASFVAEILSSSDADFRRRLISVLSVLDSSEWKLLEKMALKLAEDARKEGQA